MKMSDVFGLPVKPSDAMKVGWVGSEEQQRISEQAAAHAINCYDGLVEVLEMFEKAVDLWLPDMVSQEHAGEAEALHKIRRHMLDVLANVRGDAS